MLYARSTLKISDVKQDDSGVFTALLENIAGAVKASANLSVLEGDADEDESADKEEYVVSATARTV